MSIFRRLYQVARSQLDLPKVDALRSQTTKETYDTPQEQPMSSESHVESVPPPAPSVQYYANLELEPGAEFAEIKAAYRRLLLLYHPDRHAHDPEQAHTAEEITKGLNEAMNYFEKEREDGR